jgi:putative membrane protein
MSPTPTPRVSIAHRSFPLSKVLTVMSLVFLIAFVWLAIVMPILLDDVDLTFIIVSACLVLFLLTVTSCYHLIGARGTTIALTISILFGWFAEHMGVTRGWFFGGYTYTDVMGAKLGGVPLVVPPMWFSLTYIGSIIANLIVHKSPVDHASQKFERFTICLLGAFIVTAYDLAADPYMIHVMKAWVMEEKHGDYFGETVQGFVGWVIVSFIIMFTIRSLNSQKLPKVQPILIRRIDSMIPVWAYFALMMTFVVAGHPIETRSTAVFAMGTPIIAAIAGYAQWRIAGDSMPPGSKP